MYGQLDVRLINRGKLTMKNKDESNRTIVQDLRNTKIKVKLHIVYVRNKDILKSLYIFGKRLSVN